MPPWGVSGEVAGKTGTTNEGRDAWFVGYSSRLLAVVWVGFDEGQGHGLSGAQAALPIWADFMKQALGAYPARPFAVPDGISFADIDATNGKAKDPLAFLRRPEPGPAVATHRSAQSDGAAKSPGRHDPKGSSKIRMAPETSRRPSKKLAS